MSSIATAVLLALSRTLTNVAGALDRLAEKIEPSVRPSSDYVELVEGLKREALEDHNRQVARTLYAGQTIRQRNGLRMVR